MPRNILQNRLIKNIYKTNKVRQKIIIRLFTLMGLKAALKKQPHPRCEGIRKKRLKVNENQICSNFNIDKKSPDNRRFRCCLRLVISVIK